MAIDLLLLAASPIETADGNSISTGIWTGVAVAVTGLFTTIALQWRGWRQTANDARNMDFDRLRDEIKDYRERVDNFEEELKSARKDASHAIATANAVQLQMVTLQAAFHLVASELARHDPDNPVLKQARDLMAKIAMSDDDMFRSGLTKLVATLQK